MSAAAQTIPQVIHGETVTVAAVPARNWTAIEQEWAELSASSPYGSYFVGPEWIGSWVETYRDCLDIEILRVSHGRQLIGACVLAWRQQRTGPVWIRRVYLNAAGEDQWEETGTEFNDLLCLTGREKQVADAVRRHIDSRGWDEFVLNGCRRSESIQALLDAFASHQQTGIVDEAQYVDLAAVRESGQAFEMGMSPKVRKHLRQNLRAYEALGELRCERAESREAAGAMLEELVALHQERWTQKGQTGAFASPRFLEFHRSILSRCFDRGSIDLLRVSAGPEVIGILYNYVAENKVYFYQAGFRFTDKKRSPGTVTLFLTIQHYLASSLSEFDFMAGGTSYKKYFSKLFRQLESVTIRRATWRNALVDRLRALRNRLAKPPAKGDQTEGASAEAE